MEMNKISNIQTQSGQLQRGGLRLRSRSNNSGKSNPRDPSNEYIHRTFYDTGTDQHPIAENMRRSLNNRKNTPGQDGQNI